MKIYKWLIGFILVGHTSIAWAENCGDCFSCEDFCCNTRYHVYADYLYWRTFRSGIGALIANPEATDDVFLKPEYESGYRVGGRVLWNCLDLGVRYASFKPTSRHFLPVLEPASALQQDDFFFLEAPSESELQQDNNGSNLKYRVDYQVVDVELGWLFCFNCGNNFLRPFMGAKFAWIDEKMVFSEEAIFTKEIFKDKGYGPYVGLEGKLGFFNVCNVAVGLRARGDIALLNSSQKSKLLNSSGTFSQPRKTHLNTVLDAFIGLDLSYCGFSCFDTNLQIGYELQSYLRDSFFFPAKGQQIAFFDNIAFGGLVVRFGVYF